jgi:hypothetical protein
MNLNILIIPSGIRVDATLDFGLVKDKASMNEAVVSSV